MGQRSEFDETLLTLLWATELLFFPTWRNLTESFEGWEYRHGLKNRLLRAEDRQLIVRERHARELVCRLSQHGRQRACGGIDPEARWGRTWDGSWRQILFDLPSRQRTVRQQLWRWLRANRFGYLQHSVWVCPDSLTELAPVLAEFSEDVESFTVMEARCGPGYGDAAIVAGAWDFAEINRRYENHLQTASLTARQAAHLCVAPQRVAGWLQAERVAWQHALELDPLLPCCLLPSGYRGREAWQTRRRSLQRLARGVFAID